MAMPIQLELFARRNIAPAPDCVAVSLFGPGGLQTAGRSILAKTGVQSLSGLLMLLATGTLAHCRDDMNETEGKNE